MKKIVFTFLSLSIVLVVLFSSHLTNASEVSAASKVNAAVKKPSVVPKIRNSQYNHDSDLNYPQVFGLTNKAVQDKINTTFKNHIIKSAENKKQLLQNQSKQNPEWSYITAFDVEYNKNDKLSIIIYDYQYTGGAHSEGYAQTYNFSLKTGEIIRLNDILKNDENYTKVQKYAYHTMMKDERFNIASLNEVVVNKETPPQYVYSDNGIKLVFQLYEVAPYSEGHPKVYIPSSVYK
ncbi:DUF3298 and DUF4163 domain-containing protein [Lysinibacillus cavernae]|uniref:DUF3298 and DUF4163 domain-containing protein n=1 Tax=Lysinibacillus cavernae TaxID=2666135 RepID=UPI0012D8EA1C|nr:DUF3298 and DUF4163 domain-containing protein [Lysinibacillus cavernae]